MSKEAALKGTELRKISAQIDTVDLQGALD